MEDGLQDEVMAEFIALAPNIYPYKKIMMAKLKNQWVQKCGVKREITFEDYKTCLKVNKLENKNKLLEANNYDFDELKNVTYVRIKSKARNA